MSQPQAGASRNAYSQSSSSRADGEISNHQEPPQPSAQPPQQSNFLWQSPQIDRSTRRYSDSRSSQETENESSVELYPREQWAPPPILPAQQAFDRVALRKMVLAAAHQPFHITPAPRVTYRESPGRIPAKSLASAFNGRDHPGISVLRIVFQEHQTYRVASGGTLCP